MDNYWDWRNWKVVENPVDTMKVFDYFDEQLTKAVAIPSHMLGERELSNSGKYYKVGKNLLVIK